MTTDPRPRRPVVVVTGLSGAGKSSVLRALEDLGFEAIDNPPLRMVGELLGGEPAGAAPLAIGIDARRTDFDGAAAERLVAGLRARAELDVTLFFLIADDEVLLRRYTETRRRHPLAPQGRVSDGIARERALLEPLGAAADIVLDTSALAPADLRAMIEAQFGGDNQGAITIGVVSFSYARGLPREADLVFDVRFLRNPHYVDALRPLTGQDAAVDAYVAADPDFGAFWARMTGLLDALLPRYVREGKKYLTIAFGCTGGRHRSVAVAERMATHLRTQGWRATVVHRELWKSAPPETGASRPAPPPDAAAAAEVR
ncbi:RNase adapter RapZ [Elioraea sp.]|uniref:RNase adapter RapZ n=1 Tax=Elioraea sp. TaxID=2185103 RepID=UPI00307D9A3F